LRWPNLHYELYTPYTDMVSNSAHNRQSLSREYLPIFLLKAAYCSGLILLFPSFLEWKQGRFRGTWKKRNRSILNWWKLAIRSQVPTPSTQQAQGVNMLDAWQWQKMGGSFTRLGLLPLTIGSLCRTGFGHLLYSSPGWNPGLEWYQKFRHHHPCVFWGGGRLQGTQVLKCLYRRRGLNTTHEILTRTIKNFLLWHKPYWDATPVL
jgi:hypothetical protein